MENLILEGNINLPSINFNASTHLLKITGRSIPEHPVKFYQPIENWIVSFIATQPTKLEFFIHLDYMNTHSTECVLMILKKVEEYYKTGKAEIKVVWGFDEHDEDMEALGEDIAALIEVPIDIKEILN